MTRPRDNQQKRELNSGLCRPDETLSEIKRKRKKDIYLDLTRELKKNMKVIMIAKKLEDFEKNKISGDHPEYTIVKIG